MPIIKTGQFLIFYRQFEIPLNRTKWSLAPVAAQVRATFPVFWGISGSTITIFNVAIKYFLFYYFIVYDEIFDENFLS